MIYLASPYWDPTAAVRRQRFHAACRATVALMRAGEVVFSPVVHGHPLTAFGAPGDWEFWQPHDLEHLRRCDELVVLALGDWWNSVGVRAEILQAQEWGIPVRFISDHVADVGPTSRPAFQSNHTGHSRPGAFCGPRGEPQRESD